MTTQLEQAQARLVRASDALGTVAGHLEDYTTYRAERLAGHLRGRTHRLDVHPRDEEDRVTLHTAHQQAHLAELVKARKELVEAESWLAAVQQDAGMATLTGGER